MNKITIPTVPLFFRDPDCNREKKQRGREIIPRDCKLVNINRAIK